MIIQSLSNMYTVRRVTDEDIESIYQLCIGNPLYYEYCPPMVTVDGIQEDMSALPPGIALSDKYYMGFYDGGHLVAVMDLIVGYPEEKIVFLGFFMMDKAIQKNGIGTEIIGRACMYLKEIGFHAVQLAWVKGNPQAEHFWMKNHFVKIKETSSTAADTVILAQRNLVETFAER